jgi:hypothetical protein
MLDAIYKRNPKANAIVLLLADLYLNKNDMKGFRLLNSKMNNVKQEQGVNNSEYLKLANSCLDKYNIHFQVSNAVKLAKELENIVPQVFSSNTYEYVEYMTRIGLAYSSDMNTLRKAVNVFFNIKDVYQKNGGLRGGYDYIDFLYNFSLLFGRLKLYDVSLQAAFHAMEICYEQGAYNTRIGYYLENQVAGILTYMNMREAAKRRYENGLKILNKIGLVDSTDYAWTCLNHADNLFRLKKYKSADAFYNTSINFYAKHSSLKSTYHEALFAYAMFLHETGAFRKANSIWNEYYKELEAYGKQ